MPPKPARVAVTLVIAVAALFASFVLRDGRFRENSALHRARRGAVPRFFYAAVRFPAWAPFAS